MAGKVRRGAFDQGDGPLAWLTPVADGEPEEGGIEPFRATFRKVGPHLAVVAEGAADHTPEAAGRGDVEMDQRVAARNAIGPRDAVVALDDPGIGLGDAAHTLGQLRPVALHPARLPEYTVELMDRQAEPVPERKGQRGLARARAAEDRNASHALHRASPLSEVARPAAKHAIRWMSRRLRSSKWHLENWGPKMGMYMMLFAVSEEDIDKLETHPASTGAFLDSLDPVDEVGTVPPAPSLVRRTAQWLFGTANPAPETVAPPAGGTLWRPARADEPARARLDLDKDWHFAHFVLSGTAWEKSLPEGFLFAGKEIGDDIGYEPLRLLTPPQVSDVAAWLTTLSDTEIVGKIDQPGMAAAELYPPIDWEKEDAADLARHAKQIAQDLRDFLVERKQASEGIAIALT